MIKKRLTKGSAVLMAMALAFSAFTLPGTQAANAVDTEADCSIGFAVSAEGFDELNSVNVPVRLYRIASIDVAGNYKADAGFESVDLSAISSDDASAETWEARASEAAKLITPETVETAKVETVGGKAEITGLDTGLYLVMAETIESENYTYAFQPYLISLPNNYYYSSGNDTWVYDLRTNPVGLKPEEEARLGDLKITKNLVNQNVTSGEKATFVFEVVIEPLKGGKETKLVTLTFDRYGSKDAVVEDIPAGAKVTVTEIYSGAGYKLITDAAVTETIIADDMVGVSFTNAHDGRPNGGYGVVNHFETDENNQYQWTQKENSPE